jgi:hypothetical protein
MAQSIVSQVFSLMTILESAGPGASLLLVEIKKAFAQ